MLEVSIQTMSFCTLCLYVNMYSLNKSKVETNHHECLCELGCIPVLYHMLLSHIIMKKNNHL